MRQTCEYCCYLCTGNGIWCDKKNKTMAESTSKSTNHCKDFLFTEISAYDLTKIYKPREKRKVENHQPTLF